MSLDRFSPAVRAWFDSSFPEPTAAQAQGWQAIASGEHTLILAPTGSGKTLAAFLWGIDRLMTEPVPDKLQRTRIVYLSPLRALAVDVEKNLRAPLTGIALAADRLGESVHVPTVGMRTGDTPADERRQLIRTPPDILITTPESLYLMLTSRARETLANVEAVIVDEIHAMAPTKRGTHMALTLERLEEITDRPPQRIGLSATQRPLDEIAAFLGGRDDTGKARPVTIVDAGSTKSSTSRSSARFGGFQLARRCQIWRWSPMGGTMCPTVRSRRAVTLSTRLAVWGMRSFVLDTRGWAGSTLATHGTFSERERVRSSSPGARPG